MRRLLIFFALAVVVVVTWWLGRSPVVVTDLGPGTHLVTRDGVEFVLVGNAAAQWRVVYTADDSSGDGYPLPGGLRGWPAIDSRGYIHALHDGKVICLKNGAYFSSVELPADAERVGQSSTRSVEAARLRLVGTDASDQPVLLWISPEGPRLFVRDTDRESWQLLTQGDDEARPLAGIKRGQLLLAPGRRAVAFPGEGGWEVWLYGSEPVVRRVAAGCHGAHAVFSPGGESLILDGKVKGLWMLELDEPTLRFMAEGNLGHHDRIPFAVSFRELEPGDESTRIMAASQRDLHGYLQIFQTHLSGGGRWSLGGGSVHHYAPAFSGDGRLLSYVQAEFEDSSSVAPFEDLYLMNLAQPQRGAIHLDSRRGGRPGQGPVFAGGTRTLVYISGGRVKQVEIPTD